MKYMRIAFAVSLMFVAATAFAERKAKDLICHVDNEDTVGDGATTDVAPQNQRVRALSLGPLRSKSGTLIFNPLERHRFWRVLICPVPCRSVPSLLRTSLPVV